MQLSVEKWSKAESWYIQLSTYVVHWQDEMYLINTVGSNSITGFRYSGNMMIYINFSFST